MARAAHAVGLGTCHAEEVLHGFHGLLVGVHLGHAIRDHHAAVLDERSDPPGHFGRQQGDVEKYEDLVTVEAVVLDLLFVQNIQLAKGRRNNS